MKKDFLEGKVHKSNLKGKKEKWVYRVVDKLQDGKLYD